MARAPSQKEIAAFIIGHGITDFISGGKLSLAERNAIWKVLKKLGPPAVTTTGRLAGTAAMGIARAVPAIARGARFVTMRHPYIAAAVVVYETVKHREQIAQLAREGWEVIEDTGAAMAPIIQTEFERLMTEGPRPSPGRMPPSFLGLPKPKKRITKFNSAIKKGMAALKKSTSYGKKGKISNAKKAFALVTKTVSKLMRRKKVSSKGPTGVVKKALPGIAKITIRKAK